MDGICAIIRKENRYFMIQQHPDKPFPLQWMPVSGRIEGGESPEEATVRETREETEMEVEPAKRLAKLPGDYRSDFLYFILADWKSGEINPDRSEIHNYGWFSYEEILQLDLMKATRNFFEHHFFPVE